MNDITALYKDSAATEDTAIVNVTLIAFSLHFLFKIEPMNPPITATGIITSSTFISNPEKPVFIYVDIMFAHWEKKITATEYTAASLIVNENIRVKKATFIGPPPIPKNAAAVPSSNPDSKIAMGFLTLNVLKLPDTKIITHTKKTANIADCMPLTVFGVEETLNA